MYSILLSYHWPTSFRIHHAHKKTPPPTHSYNQLVGPPLYCILGISSRLLVFNSNVLLCRMFIWLWQAKMRLIQYKKLTWLDLTYRHKIASHLRGFQIQRAWWKSWRDCDRSYSIEDETGDGSSFFPFLAQHRAQILSIFFVPATQNKQKDLHIYIHHSFMLFFTQTQQNPIFRSSVLSSHNSSIHH